MARTDSTADPCDSPWVEELHAAIAAETVAASNPTAAMPPEEFDEVRDCLNLLNRLRKENRQSRERPRKIGRFQIVREVGRGGFGVVLAAIDPRVGRQVAIKIPRPEVLATHATRSRFLREAQAAGVLSHPNLIAIHEVGEDGPVCYIVSELCPGTNLAQWLAGRESPLSDREAAKIVIPLARAVAHAHRRGVLHRDIKPSNVLLEPSEPGLAGAAEVDGLNFRPLLTDFGLARISEFMEEHTCTGTLLGTPAYMAPEQAEGRVNSLKPATDIYALGVILYELLTGEPPLRGETDLQTLQLVARGEVPELKSRRPQVSRDLAAIAHKCLETETARRYATADDLADDLERFLDGQPTKARPTGSLVRAMKWCRRRPMAAALAAVIAISVAVSANFGWQYLEQRRIATKSEYDRQQDIAQRLYVGSINSAADELVINYRKQVRQELDALIPAEGQPDHREFAWRFLDRQLDDSLMSLEGHTADVFRVVYSPDGKLLATASADMTVRVWDAETGECKRILRGHTKDVNCVDFHPSGQQVATASDDKQAIVWELSTGRPSQVTDLRRRVFGIAFRPDGKSYVACGATTALTSLGMTPGMASPKYAGHTNHVGAVAFSPSGKWLASASEDSSVVIREGASGNFVAKWPTQRPANHLAFSSDEKFLIASNRSGRQVHLYDLSLMNTKGIVYHSFDWIHAVAFHPSDEYFAVASKDGVVDFVEPSTKRIIRRLRGHDARVWSLAFRPDGKRLVTAGAGGCVKVWDLENGSHDGFTGPRGVWARLSLDSSGRMGYAARSNGQLMAFDPSRSETLWQTFGDFEKVGDFDGNGREDLALFQHGDWHITFDDASQPDDSQRSHFQFGGPDDWPLVGDWDGDGRDNLGYYRPNKSCIALDIDGQGGCPEKIVNLPATFGFSAVPLSARWNDASADSPGIAIFKPHQPLVWDISLLKQDVWHGFNVKSDQHGRSWLPIFGRWHGGSKSHQCGFIRPEGIWGAPLPQGDWAPWKHGPQHNRLTSEILPTFLPVEEAPMTPRALRSARESQRTGPQSFAVSPDTQTIAFVFPQDSHVRVNRARSGRRLATLLEPDSTAATVSFDPQGEFLYVGSHQGTVSKYDAQSYRSVARFRAHAGSVDQINLSRDGEVLAAIDRDGAITIMRSTGEPLSTLSRDRLDRVNCLALSADGALCAVCSPWRPISVYRTDTGERVATLIGDAINSDAAAFSPDDRTLATVGEGAQVILWDTATWDRLLSLPAVNIAFQQVAFTDDGAELAAMGTTPAGRIRIARWRAASSP